MPFKSFGAVSYSPSIVTMAVSVAVCEIFSVKEWCDLENRVRVCSRSLEMAPFDRSHRPTSSYSPSTVTSAGGDAAAISWRCLIKLEWLVKKLWHVKPFLSNTRTWRTDGQTDRHTDRIALSISRVSVLTRDKNVGNNISWHILLYVIMHWLEKNFIWRRNCILEDFLFIVLGSWFRRELALYLILLLP